MGLPPNYDPTPFMKRVPPAPMIGQLWFLEPRKQFWYIIGLSSGGATMPFVTYAVYVAEGEPNEPERIENVSLEEFYRSLHTGAQLLGAKGVAWPPPEGRSMGFAR